MLEYFKTRHIGPRSDQYSDMLSKLGIKSLDKLIEAVIPKSILNSNVKSKNSFPPISEFDILKRLKEIAKKNKIFKSFIGTGYYDTILPTVIKRNILENPGWYTQYTPYQAEISQGRLEALLNYQTMIADLTSLPIANASLLDEGTAAAEAMVMFFNNHRDPNKNTYLVFIFNILIHKVLLKITQTYAIKLIK